MSNSEQMEEGGDEESFMIFSLMEIGEEEEEEKKEKEDMQIKLEPVSILSSSESESKKPVGLNVKFSEEKPRFNLKKGKMSPAKSHWLTAFHKIKSMKDPWEKFHLLDYASEFAIRHRYHALRKTWITDKVEVKMEPQPFDKGAMRSCYRIKKLPSFGKNREWAHAHNYVAKKYIDPSLGSELYFNDVKLQMDAKLWGEEFNRHNPPKKVDIMQMCVLEFKERPEEERFFHLEHFIEGEYIKYNSNSGFVEENLRLTPQAFSHFTFERSGHQLIVVDIQGVGDLWTDPQIHSIDDIYGEANLSEKGMALFFHSHQCNSICQSLSLSKFDLAPVERKRKKSQNLPSSLTMVRGVEEVCVAASPVERGNLIAFLEKSRASSSEHHESDDDGLGDDISSSPSSFSERRLPVYLKAHFNHIDENDDAFEVSSPIPFVRRVRQRYESECEFSSSFCKAEDEFRLQFEMENKMKAKPACVDFELKRRNSQELKEVSDCILGLIHHELAKYHDVGRFVEPGEEVNKEAIFFHEKHAAELGVKEAMVTLAKLYFDLPRDILQNLSIKEEWGNVEKGREYMEMAARTGDQRAILFMARAWEDGDSKVTKKKCFREALRWYDSLLQTFSQEEGTEEFELPIYEIYAHMASMNLHGDQDLEPDPSKAGDLYSEAADEATRAMKGRIANKYYSLAEEAWSQ